MLDFMIIKMGLAQKLVNGLLGKFRQRMARNSVLNIVNQMSIFGNPTELVL